MNFIYDHRFNFSQLFDEFFSILTKYLVPITAASQFINASNIVISSSKSSEFASGDSTVMIGAIVGSVACIVALLIVMRRKLLKRCFRNNKQQDYVAEAGAELVSVVEDSDNGPHLNKVAPNQLPCWLVQIRLNIVLLAAVSFQ